MGTEKEKPGETKSGENKTVISTQIIVTVGVIIVALIGAWQAIKIAQIGKTPVESSLPDTATLALPTTSNLPVSSPANAHPDLSTTSLNSQITYGPWKGQVGRLELSVDKVEVISQVGDKKILRFYLSVNNQTNSTISLPLFGNFLAIDSNGQSYKADHQISNWPKDIPAGLILTGSIDLLDPVPNTISVMKVNFSTIFGGVEFVGKNIIISDIAVP